MFAPYRDCVQGVGYAVLKKAYDILDHIEEDEVEVTVAIILLQQTQWRQNSVQDKVISDDPNAHIPCIIIIVIMKYLLGANL